ncbi:hypothetical protein M9Y10_008965 [Tritrichomonas musculus]|uniref:Uncharacterized protein n=1 Tax=Tritrichomonas musculus TaxID=1915356 RepID=A0ABR2J0C8_9EUKA
MTEPANKAGIVFFVDSFSWSKKKTPLQIDYDAIDKSLFDKSSFNEVLGLDTLNHLYFDSKNMQYKEVFSDGEMRMPSGIPLFLKIRVGTHKT